jgi:hypothetical protein
MPGGIVLQQFADSRAEIFTTPPAMTATLSEYGNE